MKTKIDIQTWSRKEYWDYFGSCDDPFFGIVANVDCTVAYETCKRLGYSFFVYYMFESIKAFNNVENFRYRLIDDEVWLFDHVHASTTIGRADNTFGFALFEYTKDFSVFQKQAQKEISEVQKTPGLRANDGARMLDVIHYTTIPWISFTSLKHEKNISRKESIPKVAFGKYFEQNGKKLMPVSVNANHGLVDGYHVARYLELFQAGLNKKL